MVQDQNRPMPVAYEDETDLRELWNTVWQGKWIIALCIFLGGMIGVAIAVTATPRYRVEVLLSSANSSSSPGSALRSQYGGLAALAGIELPSSGNAAEALAVLQSRSFVAAFISENNLMPVLFEKKWDVDQKKWKESDPQKQPTLNEGVKLFLKEILNVTKDKKTDLTALTVEWKSSTQAAEWANQLVLRANALLRARAIADSERTMAYLEQEIAKTSSVDVRQAIYRLIESQVKIISVARTQDEFAFKVLDPAVIPDLKDKVYPKKQLIAILGLMSGVMLGVLIVFVKKYFTNNNPTHQLSRVGI